jgi:RND family efflux transporter MFP subunit
LVRLASVKAAGQAERGFTGIVAARVQSNLGFRVPGKVIERLVDTGQTVVAGQPLMRIDQTDLDLAITAKDKTVSAAKAVAVQAAADEARYGELRRAGWSTQQRYEQAKAAIDSANAQLAAAEAQAQVARNESRYSLLLADNDGVVVETLAEPGQVVAAGQPVVRLARSGSREAVVNLPESFRPAIGSTARAVLYGQDRTASLAQLRQLSDAADPQTRTYEARYVLAGEAARAPLGATVKIQIVRSASSEATEVPLAAVFDDGKTTGVWVVDLAQMKVAFRPVKVRKLSDERALLDGGLQVGEQVVALGAHLLHEGDRIRIAGGPSSSKGEVASQ